ncbi:sensor histidine kinase [Companilactobacillus sp. HBUAS56275]|uniref:sensor histidine kinase n=1 Tax=Companilactobacillus sp. HBUAS56275 TaxID=3109364 RepID=UPI002FF2ABB3
MIVISIIGTIIDSFFSSLILFYIFISLYYEKQIFTWKKSLIFLFLFIYALFVEYFLPNWMIVSLFIIMYLLLNEKGAMNYYLINTIIITASLALSSSVISSSVIIYLNRIFILNEQLLILIDCITCFLLASLFIFLFRYFKLSNFIGKQKDLKLSFLLAYLYISLFLFMTLIQHFKAYKELIIAIILFLIIQTILTFLYTSAEIKNQKENQKRELLVEQINNLRSYTNQLDVDQKNMHKFKHDYRNIILSLEELTKSESNDELKETLNKLNIYSNDYFENTSMNFYKDLEYISNPYIKSLFISKFKEMKTLNIDYKFECKTEINQLKINIFDFVRLLGNIIDNAIEEVQNQRHGKIKITSINNDNQITFLIDNTIRNSEKTNISLMKNSGFTTKKKHEGLGLSNIEELKKQNSNLMINYQREDNYFHVQIILTNE